LDRKGVLKFGEEFPKKGMVASYGEVAEEVGGAEERWVRCDVPHEGLITVPPHNGSYNIEEER